MSKETPKGIPIVNLLYTTEDAESQKRTKAELEKPDPTTEHALGVLAKKEPKEHEQKAH